LLRRLIELMRRANNSTCKLKCIVYVFGIRKTWDERSTDDFGGIDPRFFVETKYGANALARETAMVILGPTRQVTRPILHSARLHVDRALSV
jgi:hypothetical protein